MNLTAVEIGTFVAHLCAVVCIGFVSGRKREGKTGTTDIFLAGRGLPRGLPLRALLLLSRREPAEARQAQYP